MFESFYVPAITFYSCQSCSLYLVVDILFFLSFFIPIQTDNSLVVTVKNEIVFPKRIYMNTEGETSMCPILVFFKGM